MVSNYVNSLYILITSRSRNWPLLPGLEMDGGASHDIPFWHIDEGLASAAISIRCGLG